MIGIAETLLCSRRPPHRRRLDPRGSDKDRHDWPLDQAIDHVRTHPTS
ncbi:hypothetical protein [Streptomyces aureoversilis]|uniref:Transposase n=1 Tax=Streptomyces aureoversilis TaxID=67277 RepID=A0ABW0AB41_9ACTN